MASQTNLFTDRQVAAPGRIKLIDEEFETAKIYTMYREEGSVLVEGTPFNAETFNRLFDELADAGQAFADFVAANYLNNSLSVNSDYFSGSIKYGKLGSLVVVYVNVTTSAVLYENKNISTDTLPSDYRPGTSKQGDWRSISNSSNFRIPMLQTNSNGSIQFIVNNTSGTISEGRTMKGEVAYYI